MLSSIALTFGIVMVGSGTVVFNHNLPTHQLRLRIAGYKMS